MAILDEIIEWALKQDDWKQDLIRRVLEQGTYTSNDIDEVTDMVLHLNGYKKEISVKPIKIKEDEIVTIGTSVDKKVILQKIESLQNVNALSSDSKMLFAENGLTVIYGENGVGKSGYTRILKKSCKAREVDEILPNVFKEVKKGTAEAVVKYSIDGESFDAKWIDGKESPKALDQIVVYDSKCGKIQVNDKNELIYLPGGTDIFKKIIDCIQEIKDKIEIHRPKVVTIDYGKIDNSSEIYRRLNNINSNTKYDDLKEYLKWDEVREKELIEVSKSILEANEEGVAKKLKSLRLTKDKLASSKELLLGLEKLLTIERLENLQSKNKKRIEVKSALDALSEEMTKEVQVEGTGSELWKAMYKAAKEFSTKEAYPDNEFPYTEGSCPLCQQELGPEAKSRLHTFQKHMEGEINKLYEDLKEWYGKAKDTLVSSKDSLEDLEKKILEIDSILNDELKCYFGERIKALRSYLTKFNKHLESIDYKDDVEIENVNSAEKFTQLESELDNKIKEVKESINPDELNKKKELRSNLNSTKIANSKAKDIENYINYLVDVDKFDKMYKQLDTGAISRKGTTIITDSLKKSFLKAVSSELTKLGGEKLPLYVDSTTKGGKPNFQLSLEGANLPKKCKIDAILSEGEQKIASLAGLLAELETAKHKNGVILDDPVTSLDHKFRKKIATRLVEEAKERQIIIFTHDIAFLFDLRQVASELQVPTHIQSIRKEGEQSGVVFHKNPWHAQKAVDRIKVLKEMVTRLEEKKLTGEKYNHDAAVIYGRMREVWERIVEEVLFNGVITRFGQGVSTQQLHGVKVEDDDYRTIYIEMGKTSKYMIGHDKSLSLCDNRPQSSEILNDIQILEEYFKKIKKRRSDLEKERKAAVTKPPTAELVE